MAADCGGVLQTAETVDVKFVTNFGKGNGLDSGGGSTMTCINPGQVTEREILHQQEVCKADGTMGVDSWTTTVIEKTGEGRWSYQFSNFIINVEAKMDMTYRQVNGENHLIVRLYDIWSYLVGPSQNIDSGFYAGLYMGGNTSYALAATIRPFAPVDGDGSWRKCLGGWWSGAAIDPCSLGTCPPGESHAPPAGGTSYYWGRNRRFDSKFVHNGNNPARMDGPLEWDLGPVTDYDNTNVYIFGRMMTGGDNACNGARFRGGTSYYGNAYKVPRINVCPPTLREITQGRDICHNCAITDFTFEPNDLLGIDEGTLVIEYVYNASSLSSVNWANAQVSYFIISKDQPINAHIPCLESSSNYCWRAKIVVSQGTFKGESEYTYGCFETLYIPAATWVVPDISEEECQLLSRGGYVEQYEEKP